MFRIRALRQPDSTCNYWKCLALQLSHPYKSAASMNMPDFNQPLMVLFLNEYDMIKGNIIFPRS
jgi:hypothetical protein